MGSILDQLRDYQPDQSLTNQGPTTGRFQTALRSMSDGQYDPSKGWLGPQAVDVVAMVGDMALAEYEKQMEKDTFLKRALGVASIPAEAAMAMGRGVRDSIAGGTKSLLDIDSRHMNNPEIMRYATEKSFDTAVNAPVLGGAASFVLNSAIPPKGALGMNVWQGGPHKYGPKGASESLKHIGKGEGAQAYGWGRYDAENPDVAADYAKKLSKLDNIRPSAEVQSMYKQEWDDLLQEIRPVQNELSRYPDDARRAQLLKLNDDLMARQDAIHEKMISKTIDNMGGLEPNLYKHDLPDEDIARYLDWDKPLSEQPESVRAALKLGNFPDAERARASIIADDTGQWFHSALDADMGSKQAASEALGKAGIPGLKYYDGMSRKRPIDDLNKTREGLVDLRKQFEQMPDGPNKDMQLAAQDAQIAQVDADIKIALSDKPQTRNYVTWDQGVLDRMKLLERNGETFSANPAPISVLGILDEIERAQEMKDFVARGGA